LEEVFFQTGVIFIGLSMEKVLQSVSDWKIGKCL
jgi:hypothetical protein